MTLLIRKRTVHFWPLVLVLTLAIGIAQAQRQSKKVIFKNDIAADASPAVLAQVLQAKANGTTEFVFEKGTYHFYPDRALEKFAHISNHNDVFITTAFPIEGLKNITIDGQGSEFIFHGLMVPFLIENSENIQLKNLSIDWATPFHSEGLVVATDEAKGTFDLRFSAEYPYELRNGQIYFLKEYYEHTIGQSILFDPATKGIMFDTEAYTPITTYEKTKVQYQTDKVKYKYEFDPRTSENQRIGRQDKTMVEELSPGLVRVHNHTKKLPPKGMILACKGEQGQNRVAPAIRVTDTNGFKATNVNVHHAGGMGLIVENSADITLDHFNITPSKGRMMSTTADATHFVGCRGKIIIQDCVFNNQLDDAVNIHGTYQRVVELLGDQKVGVRMGHFQQQGFVMAKRGDSIGVVDLEHSFQPYANLTLKSTEKVNRRYQVMTFNEPLPKNLKTGDLLENRDAYPEVLIRNCNISRNRARGLLISTPRETIIENNFFGTEMEAILVPVESGFWYESGSAANLTIRNNVFQDCNLAGFDRGVIRFVTDDDNKNIAFRNITITGNRFNHFDNLILEVNNTQAIEFSNNTVTNSGTYPMLFPKNPVVKIKNSKDLVFKNNKYQGKARKIYESDEAVSREAF